MIILVCGLPGSGKTTYCEHKFEEAHFYGVQAVHVNADKVREAHCDWDFSEEGRERQAVRMMRIAGECMERGADCVLLDFVCPTPRLRAIVSPDKIIFMDTIKEGRYADTNALFVPPTEEEAECFEHITEFPTLVSVIDGGGAE